MNLKFSIVAEREIEAAANYYEKQEDRLGLRFVLELQRAINFILQFPNAWPPISKRARRCVLRRFPYNVIYSVQQDIVIIVTVVHQHRDPEKWQTLLKELGL
ncbi:MAG: type II toxin-antitoxin system RelE/ParE family toxin [Pyrinomonadaceae bacterium]